MVDKLHRKLVHVLVENDKKRIAKDEARRIPPNYYALSHELRGAQEARDAATDVESYVREIRDRFVPARHLRKFLRTLDPTVDVHRGEWVNVHRDYRGKLQDGTKVRLVLNRETQATELWPEEA